MRVLFLDIDGVLNSEAWYRARPEGPWSEDREFDPEAMWLLRAIVAMTGCQIVVCSSWRIRRKLEDLQRLLPGLPVVGTTPTKTTAETRGAEIREYMKQVTGELITNYAILDDGSDFYDDQPLVRTDWKVGLRPRLAEKVVQILTGSAGSEA